MKRLLLALALLGLPVAAFAQTTAVPTLFSYHGKVTDASGVLIGAGTPVNRAVTFRIWASPTSVSTAASNRLYTEVQTVTIANGEFSVLLGTGAAVGAELKPALDTVFNGSERYLGITVDDPTVATDPEISPRQQMVSTAFAFRAKVAESLSGQIGAAQIASNAITAAQIAANTITANQMAPSFYSSYPDFTSGLRADLGLNVNNGGVSGTTSTIQANASDTLILNLLDQTGTSKFSAAKNGNVAVTGNLTVAGTLSATGGVSGSQITGSISGALITDNSIPAAKIIGGVGSSLSAGSVTSAHILDGTIANADIADGTIAYAKLAPAIFASDLSFTGYPTFAAGFRANLGFNVNNPGVLGNTATFQTAKHPAQPTVEDANILVLKDFGGTTRFTATKDGQVHVGNTANTNAMFTVGDVATSVTIPLKVQDSLSPYADTTTAYSNAGLSTAIVAGTAMTPTAVIKARSGDDALLFLQASDGKAKFWFNANSTCFRGDGGNAFNTFSDARLKKDIRALSGALDELLKLRSVTFEYLHAPGKTETGFVAQEVEKIFPDWVQKGDDGMLSLSIRGFEARTVQAFRELRSEKDAQLQQRDATIAALEKNVAAMKTEATETKAQLAALQQAVAALSARASN